MLNFVYPALYLVWFCHTSLSTKCLEANIEHVNLTLFGRNTHDTHIWCPCDLFFQPSPKINLNFHKANISSKIYQLVSSQILQITCIFFRQNCDLTRVFVELCFNNYNVCTLHCIWIYFTKFVKCQEIKVCINQ